MLTPRQDDLGLVETLESAGFQPRATLLVFNAGRVDSTLSNTEAFARVRRHSVLRAAIAREAVALVMPRLEPEITQEIEGKRLSFVMARDGQAPEGASFGPMGAFERAMVRRWLERMERVRSGGVVAAVSDILSMTAREAPSPQADKAFADAIRDAQADIAASVELAGLRRPIALFIRGSFRDCRAVS
jgi:hypothetical protein